MATSSDGAYTVKGEPNCSTVSCDQGHVGSPAEREPVDLAAVDLAEQKRILRMISMHKSLKEDLQASRLCMQALSSGAQPDQGLKGAAELLLLLRQPGRLSQLAR